MRRSETEAAAADQMSLWEAGGVRHPRANREACLAGWVVGYEFQRSARRTVGLTVGPQGLSVRAPLRAPWGEIERFLQSKAAWVVAKLQQVQALSRQTAAAPVWADGMALDFLGHCLTLQLDPEHGFDGVGAAVVGGNLRVALPHRATAEQIRQAVHAWFMREALAWFQQRLAHFAPVVGVHPTRLGLSRAGSRWGSARSDGGIRLNWRLIHLAPDLIDYVVVHELAHLREMNHSPAFWRVVEQVLPDQAERRRRLKTVRIPQD